MVSFNLDLAWSRVRIDRGDDFFPDPLGMRDFQHRLRDQFDKIAFSVERGTYTPDEILSYDVPKPGYFTRPASFISIRDRLLFQAIADQIAPVIDTKLLGPEIVFAFRLDQSSKPEYMFRRGVARWLEFRNEMRKAFLEEGFCWLINTDITAYFESIPIDKLIDLLASFDVSRDLLELLERLLIYWHPRGRGIPQAFDASSLLGNCYLDSLDKHITRAGTRFFRFNDDMCIFGRSHAEVRVAQQLLERELRELGLHIQTKKTVLFQSEEIRQFVDERQDEISAIDYAEFLGDATGALERTKALLDEVLGGDRFDERHFRKCINTLSSHRDDYAVDAVIARLESMPHAAKAFSNYLKLFADKPQVRTSIVDFVTDGERCLFDWQAAWLARALLEAADLEATGLAWARQTCRDRAKAWPLRCTAVQVLDKFGDPADITMLGNDFSPTEESPLQRARLKACQKLHGRSREVLFRRAANVSEELAATVAYLDH